MNTLLNADHSASLFYQACATESNRQDLLAVSMLPVKIGVDGNQYFVLWGEDLQSGVCGFGDTPTKAIFNFNQALLTPLTVTP